MPCPTYPSDGHVLDVLLVLVRGRPRQDGHRELVQALEEGRGVVVLVQDVDGDVGDGGEGRRRVLAVADRHLQHVLGVLLAVQLPPRRPDLACEWREGEIVRKIFIL